MPALDRQFEEKRLKMAYDVAEERLSTIEANLAGDVVAGTNEAADAVKRSFESTRDGLRVVLRPSADILLKGRVDFAHHPSAAELSGEVVYVSLVKLDSDDFEVMTWQAPAAGAFYDPTGYAGGEAVARRAAFVGGYRHLDEIHETGRGAEPDDSALFELLEKRSGSELTEVVATIRAEQYRLMEAPLDRTMVVQGGPGTGKTIVGLHRVSVLMFRHQRQLPAEEILVATPTDTLARFVRRVLPSLGHGDVTVTPFSRLGRHGVDSGLAPESSDPQAAKEAERVKGLPAMAEVIAREVARLPRVRKGGVTLEDRSIDEATLRAMIETARSNAGTYDGLRQAVVSSLSQELVPSVHTRDEFARITESVVPDISERELVARLLRTRGRLEEAADGLLTPSQQAAILRAPTNIGDVPWTLADLPLIDEARMLLKGRSDLRRYRQIVVDEAQDLSPMQLRLLARRMRPNGAMTILGDLAQATKGWADSSWIEHLAAGGIEIGDEQITSLETGFRVPAAQLDFANKLLTVMDIQTEPPVSVLDGDEPVLWPLDEAELAAAATAEIESLVDLDEGASVAVIGMREVLGDIEIALTDADIELRWMDTEPGAVTLLTPEEAKGLEFDHVVVARPEMIYRSDVQTGPRNLYVALTRARRTCVLMHVDSLPSALRMGEVPASGVESEVKPEHVEAQTVAVADEAAESSSPVAAPALMEELGSAGAGTASRGHQSMLQLEDGSWLMVAVGENDVRAFAFADAGGEGAVLAEGDLVVGDGAVAAALRVNDGRLLMVGPSADRAELLKETASQLRAL